MGFSYFSNKESMIDKALIHTQEMKHKYPKEIAWSVVNSTIYRDPLNIEVAFDAAAPIAEVWDMDSVTAAFEVKKIYHEVPEKICILNFASYKEPGGRFLDGSSAQEESLCHSSFLYNVLEPFDRTYYTENRAMVKSTCHLYTNAAIYSPKVRFFHNNETDFFDVLTIAAPNFNTANRLFRVSPEKNKEALASRIHFLGKILTDQRVNCVILGAFGCGVFGQSAHMVAQLFKEEFASCFPDYTIYAVPRDLGIDSTTNYMVFVNRIMKGD
jgi:uncharacterized protein (TIGR02452 family)